MVCTHLNINIMSTPRKDQNDYGSPLAIRYNLVSFFSDMIAHSIRLLNLILALSICGTIFNICFKYISTITIINSFTFTVHGDVHRLRTRRFIFI